MSHPAPPPRVDEYVGTFRWHAMKDFKLLPDKNSAEFPVALSNWCDNHTHKIGVVCGLGDSAALFIQFF